MSLIRTVMLMLPSFLLGVVLIGSIGLPLAYRRGRLRTEDETRLFEGVALARDHHKPLAIAAEPALHPLVEETLPAQFGTRAEHDRRQELTAASRREARSVTSLAYRRAQAMLALDRVVAPGRHRAENIGPDLYGTVAQRRHSRAEEQRLAHLAAWDALAEHGKAKGGFVKPGPFYVGEPPPIDYSAYTDDKVTAPALLGLTDEGPIPVARIGGELVKVAT